MLGLFDGFDEGFEEGFDDGLELGLCDGLDEGCLGCSTDSMKGLRMVSTTGWSLDCVTA
jgi:hypothetical protein